MRRRLDPGRLGPALHASDIVPFDAPDTPSQLTPHVDLSDTDITEFITAWRADFGDVLSLEEARSEALRLLHFFGTLEEALRLEDDPPGETTQP